MFHRSILIHSHTCKGTFLLQTRNNEAGLSNVFRIFNELSRKEEKDGRENIEIEVGQKGKK
jgi:hypothetical protein